MSQPGFLIAVLIGLVGVLAAVLGVALLRLMAGARTATRPVVDASEFMTAAVEDSLRELRSKERAMKARAEASERLSSEIVNNLSSGLLVVNERGIVRTMNPAGCRLLGLSEGSWNAPFREVLAAAEPLADVVAECLGSVRPIVRRSVTMPAGTGSASHLGVSVSPIQDERGATRGVICLFTDLTQVVELEEQLRIKDSLARVGELTAGIAHEFRNGLATIHGYARLLDLERVPPEFRPFIQGIRDETDALGQVVTNFLNFAKPAELVLGPVDMRTIVERAADEVRSDARARGGDVTVRGEFDNVDGDDVLLRQAFSNLCRNALEACTNAAVAPEIVLEGTLDRRHGTLRVDVIDNGPGIDAKVAERMFRPFFTTKAHGTGLGLALVQKIIVTHNGRVSAGGETHGARLVVTLPIIERA